MENFDSLIKSLGFKLCKNSCKYPSIGSTFCIHNEDMDGLYWYYETDSFIINIHDFFIKKEFLINFTSDMSHLFSLSSSYIISGNGEGFSPYQYLTSHTLYVVDTSKNKNCRFLMHANFPFLSVGITFKDKIFKDYVENHNEIKNIDICEIFYDTKERIIKPLEKISNEILNCNMNSPALEIFFESKAKEWFSIIIDSCLNKIEKKAISKVDDEAIENVANYINDHYSFDLSQELLEKIAMMSGTKMKNLFKQKYNMSITEYTQRKRMNIAETLLLTTSLEIGDVAKAVGYSSHSKFTTYFKKYKGFYPKDVKKLSSKKQDYSYDCKK